MSQHDVEVGRSMYEAFHGGDAEGALAHFAPDVVVDATTSVDGGVGHGRDELNAIIGRWIATFEGWHEEIAEVRDLGDQVYVAATQRGKGTLYATPEAALEAVGLVG